MCLTRLPRRLLSSLIACTILVACTGSPATHHSPRTSGTPAQTPPTGTVPSSADAAAYKGLGLDIIKDLVYATHEGHRLMVDVYMPKDRSTLLPGVLVIHGGGWVLGNKTWMAWEAKAVALAGMVAFSVDYRKRHLNPFPDAVHDVQAAVVWIRRNAARFDVDPSRIAAFGGSAGGSLAGELATLGSGPRDRGSRVLAAVSWSGLLDLHALVTTASTADRELVANYLPCGPHPDVTCPGKLAAASPIANVDPSDAPMFLGTSTGDYIPYTQATSMAATLKRNGVFAEVDILPETCHSIQCKTDLIIPTLGFLRTELGVSSGEQHLH